MKKIVCMILALALTLCLALTFTSCNGGAGSILDAVRSSSATKVVTVVNYKDAAGVTLGGNYVLMMEGEDSIFEYTYTNYRTVEEGAEESNYERIKTVEGKVYTVDGLSSTDGEKWEAGAPVTVVLKLNITEAILKDAVVSEDGSTLTAKIASEDAVEALGTDLNAAEDISITISTSGARLIGVVLSCKTANNADMRITTSYSYNPITLDIPAAE